MRRCTLGMVIKLHTFFKGKVIKAVSKVNSTTRVTWPAPTWWRAQVKLEPRCGVQLWRQEPDYWTTRTWDHACIHVSMFMCAVWKALWVLAVTLSLVSCSVSPRRHNTLDGHVVIGVVLGFTTKTQYQVLSSFLLDFVILVVVRLYSVIVNFHL